MQKQVIFRDRQELQAQDLNNVQSFTAGSFDTLVADTVTNDRRYAGLAVAQTSNAEVQVGTGRMYDAGQVYVSDVPVTKDLLTNLPVASKRIVAVIAFGQTTEIDTQPRSFVIDLTTDTTEPQVVPMQSWRKAAVDFIAGLESVDPQVPAIPAGAVHIANVTLGTTGVVVVDQVDATRVPSLHTLGSRTASLEGFRAAVGSQVEALSTTVSGLQSRTSEKANISAVLALKQSIARLRRELGLPAGVADYGYDDFKDPSRSEKTHPGYSAHVSGVLLFPYETPASGSLDLFNPTDPNAVRTATGLLFPRYEPALMLQTQGYVGGAALSSFQITSFETRTIRRTVTRRHTGRRYDGVAFDTLERRDTSYEAYRVVRHNRHYDERHLPEIMSDLEEEQRQGDIQNLHIRYREYSHSTTREITEYRRQEVTNTISGAIMAQTFVAPRTAWLARIGLRFDSLTPSGDVTVLLTRTVRGRPDQRAVLASSTVAVTDLRDNRIETAFDIGPVELEAGERYALIMASNGGHIVALSGETPILQGAIFYGQDGQWVPRNPGQGLLVSLYAARFLEPHVELRLMDQTRTGGITDLDIVTRELLPEGTDVDYEVQVGGQWVPLDEAGPLVTARPSTVPLRVIMSGTTDAMPAIELQADAVTVAQPATTMTHYSTPRVLPAPSGHITVALTVGFWIPGAHTLDVTLEDITNSTTLSPESASDSVLDELDTGLFVVRKTFVFTPGTPTSEYRIKISGEDTSGTISPFSVFDRLDYAQ